MLKAQPRLLKRGKLAFILANLIKPNTWDNKSIALKPIEKLQAIFKH